MKGKIMKTTIQDYDSKNDCVSIEPITSIAGTKGFIEIRATAEVIKVKAGELLEAVKAAANIAKS